MNVENQLLSEKAATNTALSLSLLERSGLLVISAFWTPIDLARLSSASHNLHFHGFLSPLTPLNHLDSSLITMPYSLLKFLLQSLEIPRLQTLPFTLSKTVRDIAVQKGLSIK